MLSDGEFFGRQPVSTEQLSGFRSVGRRRILQALMLPTMLRFAQLAPGGVSQQATTVLNRFPRMVHESFVNQVRQLQSRRAAALAALKSQQDAEHYIATVQQRIRECFGPEPERTPLNPRIVGVVERDTYNIEKLIFESRPGFPVTANVYVPRDRVGRLPGVVGTCGHSSNGKAAEAYQSFAQGLARLGYICLIYDPIGQGERSQYVDDQLRPNRGGSVNEHLHAGNQQFLVGEFLGAWRAWDGVRALDYLLTRDDVDPQQIGVTGNSSGGTMTTWLCGVEARWTMAAPSCFVTSFRRNLENELPADTEQCPPRALALGLDHADFIAAMAPKPVILLAKERDYFDARGAEQAFHDLQRLYELLGRSDNIELFTGPTTHGYSIENREAMYRFFNQVTRVSEATQEPPLNIEADQTLWCTAKGQVAESSAKTVFDFTAAKSRQLAETRTRLSGEALNAAVRKVLRLPRVSRDAPDYRILRHLPTGGYPRPHGITYAVESEPGIFAIVYMLTTERWYSRPPRNGSQAILYVSHRSSDEELRNEPLIRELLSAHPELPFFTCDVRGIGESMPDTCGADSFDKPYGCDYFYAIHSLMLDRPYVGQKTLDVIRVLDWLKASGYDNIHLVANGWGALPATFATLLSESVQQITLKHALQSYAVLAETEDYRWPLATLLPNVLSHFDLPDCYEALQSRQLTQIEPWGAADGGAR
jgi:dienelactone hydrolase